MTYTREMVLPRNAAVMGTEEMRCVDGGFRMKTKNAAKVLCVEFAILDENLKASSTCEHIKIERRLSIWTQVILLSLNIQMSLRG